MAMINQASRFATKGVRFMRHNPDETIPTASRFLGFVNTVDLSTALTSHAAPLTVKVDGVSQTKTVTCTAVDEYAVTVAEAVTDLTAAAFTGITWSADTATGRLKGVSASGNYVQVTGKLAAALDFGQCVKFGGNGLEFIKCFSDRTIGISLPKNLKDKEEIDLEGAMGSITRMVIGAKLLGLSPVVSVKDKDYELLELIQGGTYDRTAMTYDPPLSDDSEHPTFYAEIFSPLYKTNSTSTTDGMLGYEKLLLRNCIGLEGEVSIEAKAWANYAFNLESSDYFDASGVKHPAYQEATMTTAAFDALNVETV